jgi:hypothetical protein
VSFTRRLGSVVTVASGDVAFSEPAGTVEGDLLLAAISFRDNVDFTLPADWAPVGGQVSGNTFVNNSGGTSRASVLAAWIERGASAPDLTFARTGGDVAIGFIWALTGAELVSPVDGTPAVSTNGSSTTLSNSGITTSVDGSLIVSVAAIARNSATVPNAFDAATDPTTGSSGADTTDPDAIWKRFMTSRTSTGADVAIGIADAVKTTAGATGNCTATSGLPSLNPLLTFAIKAAAAGTETEQQLSAGVGTGADLAREIGKGLAALAVAAMTAARQIARGLTAQVAAAGAAARTVTRHITGAVSVGAVALASFTVSAVLVAGIAAGTVFRRATGKLAAGTVAMSGSIGRAMAVTITAGIEVSGLAIKAFGMVFSAAVSAGSTWQRAIGKNARAGSGVGAAVGKAIAKKLSAAVAALGALIAAGGSGPAVFVVELTARLGAAAALRRVIGLGVRAIASVRAAYRAMVPPLLRIARAVGERLSFAGSSRGGHAGGTRGAAAGGSRQAKTGGKRDGET